MKRVMVNFDDETGSKVEARAAQEKRSLSNYLLTLAMQDIACAGLAAPVDAEQAEVLTYARAIGSKKAVAALRRAARTQKRAA